MSVPTTPQDCIHELALDMYFRTKEEFDAVDAVSFATSKGTNIANVFVTSGSKRRLFHYADGQWTEVLPPTPAEAAKRGFDDAVGGKG